MTTRRPVVKKPPLYLHTQLSVWATLIDFLTAATHHILYLRKIYPPISFIATRAFNYPVYQNRHPDVCKWIQESMEAVRSQLEKDRVKNLSLCIIETGKNEAIEKWLFDLRQLPRTAPPEWHDQIGYIETDELRRKIAVGDIEQNFRAFFAALDTINERIQPLPDGDGVPEYTFTIAIDILKGNGRPVNHLSEMERRWIPNETGTFANDPYADIDQDDLPEELRQAKKNARPTFRPIRRLDAGGLKLQAFVVEADRKFTMPTTYRSRKERASEMSYDFATEKPEDEVFDPENGYDLGEREIHRKPAGGAFTDYRRDRR